MKYKVPPGIKKLARILGASVPRYMPTASSYSAWATFKKCPRQYAAQRVFRIRTESGPAAVRGQEIHKMAEDYVEGVTRTVPPVLQSFGKELRTMRKTDGVRTELKIAIDRDWGIVHWSDHARVFIRSVMDVAVVLDGRGHVVDYKTGRVYPTHRDQASLYAAKMLNCFTAVENGVTVEMFYIDQQEVQPHEWEQDKKEKLRSVWNHRIQRVLTEKDFDPTPSKPVCKWCPIKEQCDEAET